MKLSYACLEYLKDIVTGDLTEKQQALCSDIQSRTHAELATLFDYFNINYRKHGLARPASTLECLKEINTTNKIEEFIIEIASEDNLKLLNKALASNKSSQYKIINDDHTYKIVPINKINDDTLEQYNINSKAATYKSPYMLILEWLVGEFSITEKNQDCFTKKNFIAKLSDNKKLIQEKFNVSLSDKQMDMIATFVRQPQKGGLK